MLKKQPMKNYQVRKNKALRTTTVTVAQLQFSEHKHKIV